MSQKRRRPAQMHGSLSASSGPAVSDQAVAPVIQAPLTTTEAAPSSALDLACAQATGMSGQGDGVAWSEPVDESFIAEDFLEEGELDRAHELAPLALQLSESIRPLLHNAAAFGLDAELLHGHVDGVEAIGCLLEMSIEALDANAKEATDGETTPALAAATDIKDCLHCLDTALPILQDIRAALQQDTLEQLLAVIESLSGGLWAVFADVWADGQAGFSAMGSLAASFREHQELYEAAMDAMAKDALALFLSDYSSVAEFFRTASLIQQIELNPGNLRGTLRSVRTVLTAKVAQTLESVSVADIAKFGGGLSRLATAVQFVADQTDASAELVIMDGIVDQMQGVVAAFGPAMEVLSQSGDALQRSLRELPRLMSVTERLSAAVERVESLDQGSLARYDIALGSA